jgi:hypothetical protein
MLILKLITSKSRSFPVNKFTPDALIGSVDKNMIKDINPKCDEPSRFVKAGNALTGPVKHVHTHLTRTA